jgi:signal transduction histidine kinase
LGLPNPLFRVLISFSTLLVAAGLLGSLILVFVLLTWQAGLRELRRTRQEMHAHTADDRRRFLRRLDHELKNPLMAIRAGLANFANAPTAETRQSALSTVEAQTVRLSRLTGDLRKIAELETRSLERSAVDVEQLLNDVVDVNREKPGYGGRQIQLIVPHAPWPLPAISGDWDLLFLAFHNLLDNAMKFCEPGDAIEVRGREDGAFVVVEVADTGPGIDPADLPHIWEELYRGERGRAVPGSGLGLAMVRAIVERHDGAIQLNSRLNRGTVVTVRLPKSAAG